MRLSSMCHRARLDPIETIGTTDNASSSAARPHSRSGALSGWIRDHPSHATERQRAASWKASELERGGRILDEFGLSPNPCASSLAVSRAAMTATHSLVARTILTCSNPAVSSATGAFVVPCPRPSRHRATKSQHLFPTSLQFLSRWASCAALLWSSSVSVRDLVPRSTAAWPGCGVDRGTRPAMIGRRERLAFTSLAAFARRQSSRQHHTRSRPPPLLAPHSPPTPFRVALDP